MIATRTTSVATRDVRDNLKPSVFAGASLAHRTTEAHAIVKGLPTLGHLMWQNYIGDLARRGARHGVICGAAGAGLGVVAIRELQTGASTFLDSLVFLLLGAGGVVMLARYVPRLANIEETPEIKALANHGTPLAIANAIQSALEVDSRTLSLGRTGTVTLTNSWLVRKRFLGLDLVPLSDVVWVFKRDK